MDLTSPLPFRHQREAFMPKPLEIPVSIVPNTPTEDDIQPQPTAQATGRLSQLSSFPYPSPVYLPPRQPLPPHKLANIANALGVNMPMPASYRSPSPSGSSSGRAPSRFLLHVIPPAFLPSDDEYDDRPDPNTSSVSVASYRSQFRRGTLIPLFPTLSSQLGAIAREYNLPSTGGLVLYLVHSPSQGGVGDGPRISEEIWKLLWYRALQAERQDSQPRSASTLVFRSGRSTPSSPLNHSGKDDFQPFKTVARTATGSTFSYPSPSTSSAPSSEVNLPLADKDSSTTNAELLAAISSDLTPNPFLPILAKVEFDIDRRKASWYDAWARGRRERSRWRSTSDGKFPLNLAERARSRSQPRFIASQSNSDEDSRSEYVVLDDGEGDKTAVDEDDDLLNQTTVRLPNHLNDPLSDVFGSDGSTWSDMRQERKVGRDPDLIIPPSSDEEPNIRDEDEVLHLWEKNKRPKLPISASSRKGAPPPLKLAPNGVKSSPTKEPSSASDGTFDERKMKRRTGMVFGEFEFKIVAEPEEMMEEEQQSGVRSSQIIMKQKLDQLEKQLAQLSPRKLSSSPPPVPPVPEFSPDMALRSAPPGIDKFAHSPSESPLRHTKSTRSPNELKPNDPSSLNSMRKDSLSVLKPPKSKEHRRGQGSQSSSGSSYNPPMAEQIGPRSPAPITPQSTHLALPSSPSSQRPNGKSADRSPPHLAIRRPSTTDLPRVQQVAGSQDVLLPPLPIEKDLNSPVIPLSPDPFGKAPAENPRHARGESAGNRPPSRADGTVLPAAVPEHPETEDTKSSRFSADSEQGVESLSKQRRARSNSIMSVRSLRNLWRKSNAPGKNGLPPPPPTPIQTQIAMPPPPLPSPHPNAISFQAQQDSVRHSRTESRTSVRSSRAATVTERSRRPSAAARPDSGSDPFQFDNTTIYKSASSTSLPTSGVLQHAASGSMSQSKGILKGWQGNTSPSDSEAKRLRQPPLRRTESVASVTVSERSTGTASVNLSERSSDPSSPPSSPRGPQRLSKHKQAPLAMDPHPAFMSQSVPTSSAMSLSRYPDTLSPIVAHSGHQPQSFLSFEDGTTPRVAEFEMIPRSTPSVSYAGEVTY